MNLVLLTWRCRHGESERRLPYVWIHCLPKVAFRLFQFSPSPTRGSSASTGAPMLRAISQRWPASRSPTTRYIDTVTKGTGKHKKVIAQQVETVFPQAVSRSTDVVPDIYQKADVKDGWVQLATDLQVGERVRLIGEKKEGIHAVLEVADGPLPRRLHSRRRRASSSMAAR